MGASQNNSSTHEDIAQAAVASPLPTDRVATATGCVLIVASLANARRYPTGSFTKLTADTTREAIAALEQQRPTVVVIDWDFPVIDKLAICRMAAAFPSITVLASIAEARHAPAAIKAGCHAILLEPVTPQVALMRIARLSRAIPMRDCRPEASPSTYRLWSQVRCPSCAAPGAASFELATRRKLWFGCLRCDHVWTDRPT